jgi:hypothetical protein
MASIYSKIPGIGTGRGKFQAASRSRLFQGPDHLLIVQSTSLTEEYKRVFYRDIRYIDIRPTQGQVVQGWISGAITLLLSLLFFSGMNPLGVAALCTPTTIWFVLNLVRGPTCNCFVATQVQTVVLPTPSRHKKVQPFIAFIREKVGASGATASAAAPTPSV